MTVEEMKKRKTELGLTSQMISQMSGVPLGTVQKIFAGTTKAPRRLTIEALERILSHSGPSEMAEDRQAYIQEGVRRSENQPRQDCMLRETPAPYDTAVRFDSIAGDHRYTLDDYYALPDERRVELIDGVFYDMAAPDFLHQLILTHLSNQFYECAEQHDMPCEVFQSPCDVRLDRDNYTMVQPDLLVICGRQDYLHMKCLEGAPDLAVEILSPSSRSKDMILKLYKYEKAGVREYWIVDPDHRTVTVHFFDTDDYDPVRYSFHDQIPVRISEGKCSIDFSRIEQRLARYE
jgi:Uma2 family endonuclease